MSTVKSFEKKFIPQNYKPEIDSLRAIAVFFVICFHFELINFSGGFIGVDIFFVISGYLITNLLLTDLRKERFSLLEFYLRRIRRILPPLYVVIVLSLIASYFILSPQHLDRFGESSVSSALGVSNFFFWNETGYFDYKKLYKPLLHTWSLSIELQLYFFWPIFIFFLYRIFKENIKIIILLVILFCLTFSIIYSGRSTGFFYFSGFRLYEFAIGSFTYLLRDDLKFKFNDTLFLIVILTLILTSLGFSEDNIFPGSNALIPCLAASLFLLISGNLKYFKNLIFNNPLIYLGKISYSLYLIHWPLLIFYKYIVIEPLSLFEKICLILVTILLSTFSYKFVELPFRQKENKKFILSNKKLSIYFISSFSLIIFISHLFISNKGFENRINNEKILALNKLSDEVSVRTDIEKNITIRHNNDIYFERDKSLIKTLIMGNSYAFDFYWALRSNQKFLSTLDLEFKHFEFSYFRKENTTKDKIAEYIKRNIFKKHKFKQTFNDIKKNTIALKLLSSADIIILSYRWSDKTDFQSIVDYIRNNSSGKIIITSKIPQFFHIPTLYFKYDKDLNYITNITRNKDIDLLNQKIKKDTEILNVEYFDRIKLVCESSMCKVVDNNNLLYYDTSHWTRDGVLFYGQKLYEYGFLELIKNLYLH
jgi:peptidoglycan/LPS O-acetylase OafA/YrhL